MSWQKAQRPCISSVKEEKLALEILAKLERGVSFDHLAKRYSKCPSGRNGGDLGEFQQGAMVGPFDRRLQLSAAQTLWPGENQIRLPHHQGAVSPLARDTMAP